MTRLLSYSIDGASRFGMLSVDGGGVIDLTARMPHVGDMQAVLEGPGLAAAREYANAPTDHELDAITFERPLPWPRKIFCIGVNYGGRAAEYADKTDAAYPSVFPRFPDSFTGHVKRAALRRL